MKKYLPIALTLLSACSNNDGYKNAVSNKDTTLVVIKKTDSLKNPGYYKIEGDSVLILPFELEVSLSPKAAEKITKNKETIIVNVSFTGIPADSSQVKLGEDGSFAVAYAEKEIDYGELVKFNSIRFPKKIYDQLADKDIDLVVNVYSGRKSSKDNLLNCDILADKISNVVNKKITIKGKLIYGDK